MLVSEEVSEGVLLWNASIVLKTYLEDKARSEFSGAHVLELGAGAGHLSLALSRMGAHVTSTEAKCSHAAKGGVDACKCWGCVEQLRRSLAREIGGDSTRALRAGEWVPVYSTCNGQGEEKRNEPPFQEPAADSVAVGAVRAVELEWGAASAPHWVLKHELSESENRPAIIVMSEVIYNQSSESLYDDDFHDTLVWTLLQLVKPGTIVYNVFVDRPFSFMFFAKIDELPGKPFAVQQIKEEDFDSLGLCDDDARVYLHRLVYAPQEA